MQTNNDIVKAYKQVLSESDQSINSQSFVRINDNFKQALIDKLLEVFELDPNAPTNVEGVFNWCNKLIDHSGITVHSETIAEVADAISAIVFDS